MGMFEVVASDFSYVTVSAILQDVFSCVLCILGVNINVTGGQA